MDTAAERRRSRRYAMRFPCTVRPWKKSGTASAAETSAAEEVEAETLDISSGGFYLLVPFDWLKEGKIDCLIRLPAKTKDRLGVGVQCRGRIIRTEPREPGQMGVGALTERYRFVHLEGTRTKADTSPMESN